MPTARPVPTVSAVIPTYNRAKLLREAVESVLAQTFTDWELIVADDGSTDETGEYLDSLTDPRIRWLRLAHSGNTAVARNAAVREARGEWIAFLDSDDLWLPQKLERQLEAMAEHPSHGWSYSDYAFMDFLGEPLPDRQSKIFRPLSGWILGPLLRFEAGASIPAVLVRRQLVLELEGFDEALPLRADYDFVIRLAQRSEAFALSETLTLVREHPGRTTSQRRHAELLALNARVFRKMAAAAPNAAIRRLCRRQGAIQLAWRGRALAREGAYREAIRSLGRALLAAPLARPVWRAVVGSAANAALAMGRRNGGSPVG